MSWPVVINLKWFQRFNKSLRATRTATQDDENGHRSMTGPLSDVLCCFPPSATALALLKSDVEVLPPPLAVKITQASKYFGL